LIEDEDDDDDEGLATAPITVSLRKGASREVGQRRPAAPQANGEEKDSFLFPDFLISN
jgi:hypothetical protein